MTNVSTKIRGGEKAREARALISKAASYRRIAAGLPEPAAAPYRRRAAECEFLAHIISPDVGM